LCGVSIPEPPLPTAWQLDLEVHTTPNSASEGNGFGLLILVHVVPAHASTMVWACSVFLVACSPTATQFAGPVHDTLARLSLSLGVRGLGLATTDHCAPFHVSANVSAGPAKVRWCEPTAMQLLVPVQETPSSSLLKLGFALGLGTIDQCVPPQDSTRVESPEP
jgi:hypothetical protein